MNPPLITLLTDFGGADHYVAAMKGVILGICPEARFVDITHEITPFAILEGAYALGQAWKYFPAGTVHLAVVDPGVGSARRPVLAEAAGQFFVAPDNGILSWVLDAAPEATVRQLSETRFFRQSLSRTFHGRDLFAPVAANLACGVAAAEIGPVIKDCVQLKGLHPFDDGCGGLQGSILKIDRFGNLITNFESANFAGLETRQFRMTVGSQIIDRLAEKYSDTDKGQLFLIRGSAGLLEISMNQGRASDKTDSAVGSPVLFLFH